MSTVTALPSSGDRKYAVSDPGRCGPPCKARWWRLRPNPLRAGAWTALAVERHVDALRAEWHPVPAVLVEDAEPTVGTSDDSDSYRATVRSRGGREGQHGAGPRGLPQRGRVTTHVWLDALGRLVPTPVTAEQARFEGALPAAWTAAGVGGAVLLVGWGVSGRLERRCLEQWEAEWARVGPGWGHKTG
ncbi:hypothetical protein ACFYZ8_09165 [Streptomyces sp. NPDC001668]|uniref:Rv1733c family protein n=1 Tax=unclassified Streptomyces TaxID=2593676 RepID=UPI0036B00442